MQVTESFKGLLAADVVDEIVKDKPAVNAYPAPVVLRWAEYSKLAQEVLSSGFTFEFDGSGKPHINTLRPLVRLTTDFDAMEIASQAAAAGCLDEEAIWILEFGARSHSTPPLNSVFFPNHAGAVENAAGMAGILDAELELHWMRASPHPRVSLRANRYPPSKPCAENSGTRRQGRHLRLPPHH
jgi:hypothetical protein